MKPTCCFVACENFFPEIQAAVRQQGLTHAEVRSFSPHCCSAPMTWPELAEIVNSSEADNVAVFGSYCLRELTVPPEEISRCRIHRKEQCHHLLCSPTLVDAVQQNGTYLLSPGWLCHWQTHISEWGFDRATAIEFFRDSLQKLLLLDTGTDPESERHLAEFSDFLRLPAETLPIGLEFLGLALADIIADYQQQKLIRQKEEIAHQAAEAAMTLDLIRMVTRVKSKPEVVSAIIELFTMLFGPKKIYFIPVSNEEVYFERVPDLTVQDKFQVQQFYAGRERYFLLDKEQGSFLLRIGEGEKTFALLLISQVTSPVHINQYINTSLAVSEVCALSIQHVRTLQALVRTSHLAGKAEVATEVLHNVGNTLNSISVSSEHIREIVEQSSCTSLPDIVRLIQDHEEDQESFFTHDPRGKRLPAYFAKLSDKLTEERDVVMNEATRQLHHIHRVAEIIRDQQDTAKRINFTERIHLTSLLEESLELFQNDLKKQQIVVECHYNFDQSICGEPHKILQVVNNLIRNAVDAFDGITVEQKKISLRTYPVADQDAVVVEISDNGKGMQGNILQQAFTFGFTTKKGGHGFGLHNAANLTAEMGGSLTGESAGLEQGARFRMRLPVTAKGGTE